MVLFAIAEKEQPEFLTLFPLQLNILSPERALCYLLYGIFVINLFWPFLPEANAESHPFLFGSIPCILQWHPSFSLDVPTSAKALHSLRNILLISVGHIFGQTLKKIFFSELGN